MKIIAINGLSSSGKSTLAEYIASKLPNSVVVHGDYIMLESFMQNHEALMHFCGRTFDSGEQFFTEFYIPNETFELLNAIVTDPNLDANFKVEVDKAIDSNPNADYIIVEWTLCNFIKSIWDIADATISIKITPEAQQKVFEKHVEERDDVRDALELRNAVASPYFEFGEYVILNNIDDKFFEDVDRLVETIK